MISELRVLTTKEYDSDEVSMIEPHSPLSTQFNNKVYSDFIVQVKDNQFRLHKVILSQSPFFKQFLDQDSCTIDCDATGLEICLLDLYHSSRSNIKSQDILKALDVACYLELHDLAYFCYDFILTKLQKLEDIILYCSQLQKGNITEKYYSRLNQAILGTLLYCSSICSNKQVDEMTIEECPVHPDTPLSLFLAQLPLVWIEKVMKSDLLCVACEFDRYSLVKQILRLRQSRPVQVILEHSESESESESEKELENVKESVVSGVAKKVYSLFDGLIPRPKKRKLEDSDDETVASPVIERIIKPLPNRPTLPQTISSIYEFGIIYTYMTFPQLGVVKKDEIVPLHLALESYWLQAELGTNDHGKELPPFRFAYCFTNVTKYFEQDQSVMTSDPVMCAGVQYRLLLCKENNEIKALLQKSKGKGPLVSYSIYAFDHRCELEKHQVVRFTQPVTTVKNGQGFANPLTNSIKTEQDRIWLTCSVTFE
jgi:hypothetical protein